MSLAPSPLAPVRPGNHDVLAPASPTALRPTRARAHTVKPTIATYAVWIAERGRPGHGLAGPGDRLERRAGLDGRALDGVRAPVPPGLSRGVLRRGRRPRHRLPLGLRHGHGLRRVRDPRRGRGLRALRRPGGAAIPGDRRDRSPSRIGSSMSLAIRSATAVVLAELLMPRLFPWHFGHTQIAFTPFVQVAGIGGAMAVSFLMFWLAEVAVRVAAFRERRRAFLVPVAVFGLAMVYGMAMMDRFGSPRGEQQEVVLVQGHVGPRPAARPPARSPVSRPDLRAEPPGRAPGLPGRLARGCGAGLYPRRDRHGGRPARPAVGRRRLGLSSSAPIPSCRTRRSSTPPSPSTPTARCRCRISSRC